jgi:hypothetical protein
MFKVFLTLFPHIDILSNVVTDMLSGTVVVDPIQNLHHALICGVYNLIIPK